jgi:hypothetical protein
MAASDTGALVAAAAIGAGGAVSAQVISAVVTARKATKQFNWERYKQERDWKMREDERFLSLKQELYSNYDLQITNFLTYIDRLINPLPGLDEPQSPDFLALQRLKSNIDLVAAEEVWRPVDMAYVSVDGAVSSARSHRTSYENRKEEAAQGTKAWLRALEAMRADLRGELRKFNAAEAKEVDVKARPKWLRFAWPWKNQR